jgi:1-acyl-sn-glycerol-3-phosphate acyltransferase
MATDRTKGSAKKASTANKTTAKTTTAKKTTAKKTTAKKTTAKRTTAKKTTAKRTTAPKATAKRSTAAKTSAPRTTTKRSTGSPEKAASATTVTPTASASTTSTSRTSTSQAATPRMVTPKRAASSGAARGSALAGGLDRAAAEPRTASPLLRATRGSAPSRGPERGDGRAPADGREMPERVLRVVPDPAETLTTSRNPLRGGPLEGAVTTLANLLRTGAHAAGLPADEAEEQVARTLAYLRRRAAGDYTVDEFGFDADFTENVWLPLLRPIYERWFRVEVRGIENIPVTGGALVVANHSGTLPLDGLMTQVAIHDSHPGGRHLRMLGADLVFELPFVGTSARRTGSTLATAADAERLLRQEELVGVYPEGFKGIGKPFGERYKLQRFGRGGFVSAALRTGAPIIPCSIVGAEEIYPLIGNMPILARLMGAPYFPVTPFFPLLGPLGLIPLPSKWIIAFGEPVDTGSIGPAGADDPMLVFDLTDQIRETIQQTLYSLLMQRRSVFF